MSTGNYTVPAEAAGQRLDAWLAAWLAAQFEGVSRARVQLLVSEGKVTVDGTLAKASLKLRGGETVAVLGPPEPPPLRATPEMIPLDIVYEDDDLSVINKPAGMMVHAGAGATHEDPALDERNRGTLVNALLGHYSQLSTTGGALRPGIVHRLDKQTSGLIIVARNDAAHLRLAEMFSSREVHKTYLALVHGHPKKDTGTINAAIGRDLIRRTRMTTKRSEGARAAISHYTVLERLDTRFGKFALVSVKIETGRTHQIRVHMSSIGHPVVGDTLYGAPAIIPVVEAAKGKPGTKKKAAVAAETTQLDRNFLHAARLEFAHPRTNKILTLEAPLPAELTGFLDRIR
ncbi:RluA family pseudouridine synthase [Silvibacterium dinghuense]|uniref:Pseudouridine synthase n=1 Tax=Silvibacterium dinghuense TaxID=1560006 RepID=A0A4Q1SJP2_9BACT|nr:RluA family pseudouridine synthase [Silvibacterium dinghuense]RXS97878.1 RluA family pseudouridine synthase [Silvibacterium dinghuense]GGH02678.1 pseudouridine synthase [Silvibacterium dinghuense]